MSRHIAWFSCGAASSCAANLCVATYPEDTIIVYCDTMASEHPDNRRFMEDVSKWIGRPIQMIGSEKYASVDEVFMKERYMAGVKGAKCTVEMKKVPRFAFQRPDDIHVFGFTSDETVRVSRFRQSNPELLTYWPLLEEGMTKQDCFRMLEDAGIELPKMYKLGFKNNNCIGCVKSSSPSYWNRIRHYFPGVFETRAQQSRELGCRLIQLHGKRIYLDELPNDAKGGREEHVECGPQCGTQLQFFAR